MLTQTNKAIKNNDRVADDASNNLNGRFYPDYIHTLAKQGGFSHDNVLQKMWSKVLKFSRCFTYI